jgi:hypothetical protein
MVGSIHIYTQYSLHFMHVNYSVTLSLYFLIIRLLFFFHLVIWEVLRGGDFNVLIFVLLEKNNSRTSLFAN